MKLILSLKDYKSPELLLVRKVPLLKALLNDILLDKFTVPDDCHFWLLYAGEGRASDHFGRHHGKTSKIGWKHGYNLDEPEVQRYVEDVVEQCKLA